MFSHAYKPQSLPVQCLHLQGTFTGWLRNFPQPWSALILFSHFLDQISKHWHGVWDSCHHCSPTGSTFTTTGLARWPPGDWRHSAFLNRLYVPRKRLKLNASALKNLWKCLNKKGSTSVKKTGIPSAEVNLSTVDFTITLQRCVEIGS